MTESDSANTTTLPQESRLIRQLTYRMFRKEGLKRSRRYPGGRPYRLPAVAAWRLARQFPALGRQYAEALS